MNENEDPASRKRRLAYERQKRWRARQSQESLAKIRALDAASHQERVNQMTPQQLTDHRNAHAVSQRKYIERMSAEQSAAHRVDHAASQHQYIQRMTAEQSAAHHVAHAASQHQYIQSMTAEQSDAYHVAHAASQHQYIQLMTAEQSDAYHVAHAASQHQYIQRMTAEQSAAHHVAHAASQHQYIQSMTAEQSDAYHVAHAASQHQYIQRMTAEQSDAYHVAHSASQHQYIQRMTAEQSAAHHVAHAASQHQYIQSMTAEQSDAYHVAHAASQHQYIQLMTAEQSDAYHVAHAASQHQYIQRMTAEQSAAHHVAHAASQHQYIQSMTAEQSAAHHVAHAASQHQYIQRMTAEQTADYDVAHAASQRQYIEQMTAEQSAAYRIAHNSSQQRYIDGLTLQQLEALHTANAVSQHQRIERMAPEEVVVHNIAHTASQQRHVDRLNSHQTEAHRMANTASHQLARQRQNEAIRNEAIHFVEARIDEHSCGSLNHICRFCDAKHFKDERPSDGNFTSCCRKGKIKLPKPMGLDGEILEYPSFLQSMLSDPDNPHYSHFRAHIRSYNNTLSFASMGAKIIDLAGRGPYVFKINGQTHHKTSHIQPINNETPQYAQLYVLDSTQATDIRQNHAANNQCRRDILERIDRFYRVNNRIAASYMLMHEIEEREAEEAVQAGLQIPVISMALRRDRQSDQRRYNAPTSNEVAMIFVNEDGEPPFERDIHIYPKNPQNPNQKFINLHILSPNMDPMTYSILFPFGEPGWQPNWQCDSYEGAQLNRVRNNISMLQFKCALTSIRDQFNPIISAGKLTQQWLVDSYLQVEANNLNYIKQNQQRLRAEQYAGLADHVANLAQQSNIAPGTSVILPSSFEGSPRNMRERCCDSMSIFSKWGAPDLFITFTANPKWNEITENLRRGEQVSDRPDLVARVFKIKLYSLIDDLAKHDIFGKSLAYVYSIEFQKRGLPHAHILVTLAAEHKFTTAQRIDEIVSAEIPSLESNPRLREIVLRCMMHGPCGPRFPNAPCITDGKCSKKFPKAFNNTTSPNVNGYASYRRRSTYQVEVRGVQMDSRNVVPYNPYLALKYNAHINVEVCTSLRAIKYIYKYIFKGFDCANVAITSNGESELRYNEVTNFINCRYVSAPEAIWRLREYPMHDRSHNVMRLPVHLENQQRVIFQEGSEEEALLRAQTGSTKLQAWFKLNETDINARQYLYFEIPHYYVFSKGSWQVRKRGGEKVLGRMYTVGVKDEERFYLRILLLHVRGATSFESLRIVDNIVHQSFKSAAAARGLIESDDEWNNCLIDGAIFLMPKQLREMFAYICCFCQPSRPLTLWENHVADLSLDYMRNDPENVAINKALHDINYILQQHGLCCENIGLPVPIGSVHVGNEQGFDILEEERDADVRIAKLNEKQHDAFNQIIAAINSSNLRTRCFFLDGPGGSGKTFLYETLLAFIRGRGEIALAFATTGIASTLLKCGRTVHSGFKLPVPLLDTSVSSMRLNSPEADKLRNASLILIDEITMLPKNGLRCIDKLLKEIMKSDANFGGKTIVVGGDFRQTLPVVPRGTRTEIIECCIKSSPLWNDFKQITLSTNMRSEGQNEHNDWLLKVGSAKLPRVAGIYEEDVVEIPTEMILTGDLIGTIFGDLQQMSMQDLSKRVIVAPTNAQSLEINRKIIDLINGNPQIYYSADSVVSEDPNDALNFPVEFLNEQTPSGMPPHVLLLKKGVIIMLMRNLNPKKGLCNGTRLIVEEPGRNLIKAKIISTCNQNDTVLIPRIDLAPTDTTLPFILKRRQFPIIPAYAITINKAQGQSFDYVGINLETAVFSHGQLYVALSRSKVSSQVKICIQPNPQQGKLLNDQRQFTRNIVFKEILD